MAKVRTSKTNAIREAWADVGLLLLLLFIYGCWSTVSVHTNPA